MAPPHLLHPWRIYNLLPSLSLFRSISLTVSLSLSFSFSLSFRPAPVILFLLFQKADRSKTRPLLSPPEGFVPISLSLALCGPFSGFMPCSNSPFVIWVRNTFTHTDTQIHTVTHNRDKPPEEREGFSKSGGILDLRGPEESSPFRLLHSHKNNFNKVS